jgi:hypothetical protein
MKQPSPDGGDVGSSEHRGLRAQHSADIVGTKDDPLYNTAISLRVLSAP